jgi:hypothetical protein
MGLFDYFRRRRERESALSAEQLAPADPTEAGASSADDSIAAAIREANSAGSQSVPGAVHDAFRYSVAARTGSAVQGIDYRKLQQLQSSVLAIMKEHGIDPMRPDPSRFMDPEVQRALQEAGLQHGLGDSG